MPYSRQPRARSISVELFSDDQISYKKIEEILKPSYFFKNVKVVLARENGNDFKLFFTKLNGTCEYSIYFSQRDEVKNKYHTDKFIYVTCSGEVGPVQPRENDDIMKMLIENFKEYGHAYIKATVHEHYPNEDQYYDDMGNFNKVELEKRPRPRYVVATGFNTKYFLSEEGLNELSKDNSGKEILTISSGHDLKDKAQYTGNNPKAMYEKIKSLLLEAKRLN